MFSPRWGVIPIAEIVSLGLLVVAFHLVAVFDEHVEKLLRLTERHVQFDADNLVGEQRAVSLGATVGVRLVGEEHVERVLLLPFGIFADVDESRHAVGLADEDSEPLFLSVDAVLLFNHHFTHRVLVVIT